MKITSISAQARIPIELIYRSMVNTDSAWMSIQVADLGVRVGKEYTDEQLAELESESQFGKLYARTLEYCLMRPHSAREVRDYLWRKTRDSNYKTRSGEIKQRPGVSADLTERVFRRLVEKGYINDEQFARYWVENRHQRKGVSRRKLVAELRAKGVDAAIIEAQLSDSSRDDREELRKVIAKRARRYDNPQKLIAYLARQGFSYDDIKSELDTTRAD